MNSINKTATGDPEWHTPPEIIDSVLAVLGRIDLDPASNALANKTVKAKTFYSKDDSGLDHEWKGKVFMNPPFNIGGSLVSVQAGNSRAGINTFVEKLLVHTANGSVTEAIILTPAKTDTQWFQDLFNAADTVSLTYNRIRFHKPDGVRLNPPSGSAFFYFGSNPEKFMQEFKKRGYFVTADER